MIYRSIDTIPAKLFFKITETGNISLLSNKKTNPKKLEEIWKTIEEEHASIAPIEKTNSVVNISKKIESLGAKYQTIQLAIRYLRNIEDVILMNILTSFGYKFTDNRKKDLLTIERESKAIELIINKLNKKLPSGNNSFNNSFEEVIMQYSILTEVGFINSNTITIPQYYALIQAGNQKIKILENNE